MGVKVSEMASRTKMLKVKWDTEVVDVSYFPHVVTPHLLDDIEEAAKRDGWDVLSVMLEPVIDWWDILDDKGNRIPSDAKTIKTLPMSWINSLQTAIQEDRPPEESS